MSLDDCFQLEVWKGDWELPSIDVDCLKVLSYAKFIDIKLNVKATNNPFRTRYGQLPVLKYNESTCSTVEDIFELFCQHCDCKQPTNSSENSETHAFHALIEECLSPALKYLWWVDEQNFNEVIRPLYCKALPFPFNYYYPGQYEKKAKLLIDVLYPTVEPMEVENLVYSKAKDCISFLSSKLGESDYFFGHDPKKIDALVFAYLAPLLKITLPNSSLQSFLIAKKNLVNFITRILDRYFKEEQEFYKLKLIKQSEAKQLSPFNEYLSDKRHEIFAGIFATAAMLGYAFSTGIMQIQNSKYNSTSDYYNLSSTEYDE